jgi:crotonobetainyl-CoA:carnitine CoA-transferase CaiB-like acyl-CoA transferase
MRILEVGDGIESAKAAQVFRLFGHEVIKVEDGGDPASIRCLAPIDGRSPLHLALNAGKLSVAAGLEPGDAEQLLFDIARTCDGVVVGRGRGRAIWDRVCARSRGDLPPALLFSTSEFTYEAYARSGVLVATGDRARPPLSPPTYLPAQLAGVLGALGLLIGMRSGAEGVCTSALWAMTSLFHRSLAGSEYEGADHERENRFSIYYPVGIFPVRDGRLSIHVITDDQWLRLCLLMERPELATDPRFQRTGDRRRHADELDEFLLPWLATQSRADVVSGCQELGVPCGAIQSVSDYIADPHTAVRGSLWEAQDEEGGCFLVPGIPNGSAPGPGLLRVPTLGGHTEMLRNELTAAAAGGRQADRLSVHRTQRSKDTAGTRPLDGVLVLDLSHAMAGPMAGWLLGGMGATVLKLERPQLPGQTPRTAFDFGGTYPDGIRGEHPWNREGVFNFVNSNKKGITLNLVHPVGKQLLLKLVERADVLIENFSTRVMKNIGIEYDYLSAVNPRLVYASIKSHGLTGPKANYVGFVETANAEAGLASVMTYDDGVPQSSKFPFSDIISAVWATTCIMNALHARDRSGRGALVDVSMVDAVAAVMSDFVVAAQVAPPGWTRSTQPEPVLLMECADGQWLAVCQPDVERSHALCLMLELPPSAAAESKRSALERLARTCTRNALAARLSEVSVHTSPVQQATEVSADPVFGDWFWCDVDHPEVGARRYPRVPIRLVPEVELPVTPAPLFAQHTREVFEGMLGMPAAEVDELMAAGIL